MSTALSSPMTYRKAHGAPEFWSGAMIEDYLTSCAALKQVQDRLERAAAFAEANPWSTSAQYLAVYAGEPALVRVLLPLHDGSMRAVVAEQTQVPGLVVHPEIGFNVETIGAHVWRVTHRSSGRSVGWLPSRSAALRAADCLAYLVDWSVEHEALIEQVTGLADLITAVLQEHGGGGVLRFQGDPLRQRPAACHQLAGGTPRMGKSAWGGAA
jgi:hypothetical protein